MNHNHVSIPNENSHQKKIEMYDIPLFTFTLWVFLDEHIKASTAGLPTGEWSPTGLCRSVILLF